MPPSARLIMRTTTLWKDAAKVGSCGLRHVIATALATCQTSCAALASTAHARAEGMTQAILMGGLSEELAHAPPRVIAVDTNASALHGFWLAFWADTPN